jgi:fucose permease
MVACNLSILLIPPVFGLIADFISVKLFPVFLGAWAILMILSTLFYNAKAKRLNLLDKEF